MADQNRPRYKSENLVWDSNTLEWVGMTQPLVNTDILSVSADTNITKVNGFPVDTRGGSADDGTLRVITASNSQISVINSPPLAVWTGSINQLAGVDSYPIATSDVARHTYAIDYVGGSNPIYMGVAPPGSATSSSVWQIRKLSYDGSGNVTNIQFGGGSPLFIQVWDSRAGLTYS